MVNLIVKPVYGNGTRSFINAATCSVNDVEDI